MLRNGGEVDKVSQRHMGEDVNHQFGWNVLEHSRGCAVLWWSEGGCCQCMRKIPRWCGEEGVVVSSLFSSHPKVSLHQPHVLGKAKVPQQGGVGIPSQYQRMV